MYSKYYNTISKIKADDEFKEKLVDKITNEKEVINEVKIGKGKTIWMKIKKIIIAIIYTLVILLGSGTAYAALGGTINGVPLVEWMGIKFSDKYQEYVEPVEYQSVEGNGIKVTLESTVSTEGYTVLQFRVNFSEEIFEKYKAMTEEKEEIVFCYLSFNDPIVETEDGYKYVELNGANYNVIIDGKKEWVRGSANATSMEKVTDTEYLVYQIWFLSEDKLKNKTDFKITLNNIAVGLGEDCIPIEGQFEIEISKEKALKDTTIISGNEVSINYKDMTQRIEKVIISPLQNIVKISKVIENASTENLCNLEDEDYVGTIEYKVYDQNNNELLASVSDTANSMILENGEVVTAEPGELYLENDFENAILLETKYLAIEKNDNISNLRIEVFESNEYYKKSRKIGEFLIDLKNQKLQSKNYNIEVDYLYNSKVEGNLFFDGVTLNGEVLIYDL